MKNQVGRLTVTAVMLYVSTVFVTGCNRGPEWDKSNPDANKRTGVPQAEVSNTASKGAAPAK